MSQVRLKLVLTILAATTGFFVPVFGGVVSETPTVLRELVVSGREKRYLHVLGYVREYSTLTTFTDTIFMFREKTVDFMLPPSPKSRLKGWQIPRVLASRSYYRFTDATGRDSVSDRCSHHFSWADRIGMARAADVPLSLRTAESGRYASNGKYSPAVTWEKNGDLMTLDIDVLADSMGRQWVPGAEVFFHGNTDFERFRLNINYDGVVDRMVSPADMTGYSFYIESNGRGRGVYVFDRPDTRYSVSTYAEVYLTDKEYITGKEAKKWERSNNQTDFTEILEAHDAPELAPDIQRLIARVNSVDRDQIRVNLEPNHLLVGRKAVKLNVGQAILQRIKGMFGIDYINAERKWRRSWNNFRRDRLVR